MRNSVKLAAALVATTSLSAAADSRSGAEVDWAGFYVGASIGSAQSTASMTDGTYNGLEPDEMIYWDATSRKPQAGLFLGYNLQQGAAVFGVEASLQRHAMSASVLQTSVDIEDSPDDLAATLKGGIAGALSLRLGHARARTLYYVKAGAIYSGAKVGIKDDCIEAPCGMGMISSDAKLGWGYQLGLGVEHALSKNWSLRAEYTYADFGKKTIHGVIRGDVWEGTPVALPAKLDAHSLSLGLSYRF